MAAESIAYLDNNGTTMVSPEALASMWEWTNRGNPSARYPSAAESRRMMRKFRTLVAEVGRFDPKKFEIIFTSGGSESNCHILTSSVRAYRNKTGAIPRVITSTVEHSSIIKCCRNMKELGEAEIVFLPVRADPTLPSFGTVDPADLEAALTEEEGHRTCLVSIMAANNETGAINPVNDLAARAFAAGVPFHTDAVQIYGKSPIYPDGADGRGPPIDAISASFHKLEGPPGCGLLIIRKSFLLGYGLGPLVCGAQNDGHRGGTENIPAIAGSFRAYKEAMVARAAKNARLASLTARAFLALGASRWVRSVGYLADFDSGRVVFPDGAAKTDPASILWIRGPEPVGADGRPRPAPILPNTLLLAVLHPLFCNLKAQDALGRRGVYVGIGSTCNTAGSAEPSHVVKALAIPDDFRPGILRISLGDSTTEADLKKLAAGWDAVFDAGECFTDS